MRGGKQEDSYVSGYMHKIGAHKQGIGSKAYLVSRGVYLFLEC